MLSRALQLRDEFPELTVVIVGDFNLPGETEEYAFYVDLFAGDPMFFEDNFPPVIAEFVEGIFGGRYEEISGFGDGARNVPGFDEDEHYTNSPDNDLSLCFDENTFDARLDYVLVIPPVDESISVSVESLSVVPFRGQELTDLCDFGLGGDPYQLDSDEKSDHWAVEAEIKFFRN